MKYFPSFYCLGPNHNGKLVRFDEKLRKPVSGTCGHSVCQQCENNNPHMKCPICAQENVFLSQEPDDQAMEMTVKCRDNFLEVLRFWRREEKLGTGACSTCSARSPSLSLCLDCHSNLYLKDPNSSGFILKAESLLDLMELSRNVLCSNCAVSQHLNKGHRIEKLEEFAFDKRNIKTIPAKEILALFREKLEQKRNKIDCKLRRMRLEYVETQISELLERNFDGGDPQNLRESIRHALIGLHIEHLIMKTEELIVDSSEICECSRIYRKLAGNSRNFDYLNRIYNSMAFYRI
ncbi:hypothetical protein CAEBREN_15267 [Caenorhabditis brenneri]|uniref:RING-type domain-containing protein n=1 Tax=Caenorhabditis brenneri TaxID=135651 RepID=G0P5A3_CAEBE|nr:hypothetical protein CAEBREN_15267 [Caenorhabditis brenneri]